MSATEVMSRSDVAFHPAHVHPTELPSQAVDCCGRSLSPQRDNTELPPMANAPFSIIGRAGQIQELRPTGKLNAFVALLSEPKQKPNLCGWAFV
jgi:hypothetical protein